MKALRERAEDYELNRWAVVKLQEQEIPAWCVCSPDDWSDGFVYDKEFDTFAEAIQYAQRRARA